MRLGLTSRHHGGTRRAVLVGDAQQPLPEVHSPVEWFVYGRAAIERVAPHDVPHVVVSITSAADDVARIPRSGACRGIPRLMFADIDVAVPGVTLFSVKHAAEILDFVFGHTPRWGCSRDMLACSRVAGRGSPWDDPPRWCSTKNRR